MAWTPVQKFSIGAGWALLVLALFGLVALNGVMHVVQQQTSVADANGALEHLSQVQVASAEAERAGTAYLSTGDERDRLAFAGARSDVEDALDELHRRSEDNPRQRAALDSLAPFLADRLGALSTAMSLRERAGADSAAAFWASGTERARLTVVPLVQRLRDEELRRLAERTRMQAARGRLAGQLMLAGSILAFVLAAVAFRPVSSAAGKPAG